MERRHRSLAAVVLGCLASAGCWGVICDESKELCVKERPGAVTPNYLRKGLENKFLLKVMAAPFMVAADGKATLTLNNGRPATLAAPLTGEREFALVVKPPDQPTEPFGIADLLLYVGDPRLGSAKVKVNVEPGLLLETKPGLKLTAPTGALVAAAAAHKASGQKLFLELETRSTPLGRTLRAYDHATGQWMADSPSAALLIGGNLGGLIEGTPVTIDACPDGGVLLTTCPTTCTPAPSCAGTKKTDGLDAFAVGLPYLYLADRSGGKARLQVYTYVTGRAPPLKLESQTPLVLGAQKVSGLAATQSLNNQLIVLLDDGSLRIVTIDGQVNPMLAERQPLSALIAGRQNRPTGESDKVRAVAVGKLTGEQYEDLAVIIDKSIYLLHHWQLDDGKAQVAGPYTLGSDETPSALAILDPPGAGSFADLAVTGQPADATAPATLYLLRNHSGCAQADGCP